MKVTVGDTEFLVEFECGVGRRLVKSHSWFWKLLRTTRFVWIVQDITLCSIRDASGSHTTDRPPVVAAGRVARYHLDAPNEVVAEKFALRAALKDLDRKYPVSTGDCLVTFPRRRRHLFWDAFLARKSHADSRLTGVSA